MVQVALRVFHDHAVWLCLLLVVYIYYRFAAGSKLLRFILQLTGVPLLSATGLGILEAVHSKDY